jgi:predicted transcriptional regulator
MRHTKLNDDNIREILVLLERKVSQTIIAKKFGVSQVTISKVATGHRTPNKGIQFEEGKKWCMSTQE